MVSLSRLRVMQASEPRQLCGDQPTPESWLVYRCNPGLLGQENGAEAEVAVRYSLPRSPLA